MCWRSHQAITNFSILQRRNNYKVTKIARNVANKIKTVCVSKSAKIPRSLLLGLWLPQCKNIENPINSVCVFRRQYPGCVTSSPSTLSSVFTEAPFLMVFWADHISRPGQIQPKTSACRVLDKRADIMLSFLLCCYEFEKIKIKTTNKVQSKYLFSRCYWNKMWNSHGSFPPKAFWRVCVGFSHHAFSSVTCAPHAPWGLGRTHGLIWSF